jgi:hypothetical protein
VRQIKQHSRDTWGRRQYCPKQVAIPTTDICDTIEMREIVGRENACYLSMCLGSHGIIEKATVFGVIGEIAQNPPSGSVFSAAERPVRSE